MVEPNDSTPDQVHLSPSLPSDDSLERFGRGDPHWVYLANARHRDDVNTKLEVIAHYRHTLNQLGNIGQTDSLL